LNKGLFLNKVYIVGLIKNSMARSNTRYGAFDVSLEDEIKRIMDSVEGLGIRNVNKIEASALIAEKNRKAKMSTLEVREFFARLRGLK
jgi:hypothetical protein